MSSELYIQSLQGEYQIDLLDHCCAWRIAKEDLAGESKHALAKSILVQTSKCSRFQRGHSQVTLISLAMLYEKRA